MAYLKSTQAYVYDNLNAPIGTKMVFNQTSSPLGWTKETGSNDVALRLISGTVGTGGTVAFETCFASVTPSATSGAVAATTLAAATIPNHFHDMQGNSANGHNIGWTFAASASTDSTQNTLSTGSMGGGSHTHSFTQPSISAVNLDVSYVDVMIATKE